jgi:hypothetical protein
MLFFQCSQDGWDDFAGSKFALELAFAEQSEFARFGWSEPRPGIGRLRLRVGSLLTEAELEAVRSLQNQVIDRLPRPPSFHWILQDPRLRSWYLEQFEPVASPFPRNQDLWLRYHGEEDVRGWSGFVGKLLPDLMVRFRRSPP